MPRLDRHLRVVEEIAEAAQGTDDPCELLRRLCASVARGFAFERVAISRYDPALERLEFVAAYGIEDEQLRRLPLSLGAYPIVRRAFESRQIVFMADGRAGAAVSREVADELGLTSALAVPLCSGGRCLGHLGGDCAGRPFRLDDETRRMLTVVAIVGATLLDRDEPTAAGRRLEVLAGQLRDLSRLERHAVAVRRERLRLRARIVELVAEVAGERGRDVTVAVPHELEARIDPAAFDRILGQLLTNALRHGGPPIQIGVANGSGGVTLFVEDSGCGVSPDLAPRLFDRFTRGCHAALDAAEGAGLGLALGRAFARAQGGDLVYEPRRPRGARFLLTVPE